MNLGSVPDTYQLETKDKMAPLPPFHIQEMTGQGKKSYFRIISVYHWQFSNWRGVGGLAHNREDRQLDYIF